MSVAETDQLVLGVIGAVTGLGLLANKIYFGRRKWRSGS